MEPTSVRSLNPSKRPAALQALRNIGYSVEGAAAALSVAAFMTTES